MGRIKGQKRSTCKLCLKERDLCKSHIVPEWCYEYESSGIKRQIWLIETSPKEQTKQVEQKGYREYLLCKDCEGRLCKHETAISQVWQTNRIFESCLKPHELFNVQDVPYQSMKLFLLSVFWRASVSEGFGRFIQLGPYAEKLRNAILSEDYIKPEEFPIVGTLVIGPDNRPFRGMIRNPVRCKVGGTTCYSMLFAGCEWLLIVSDHWINPKVRGLNSVVVADTLRFLVMPPAEIATIRDHARHVSKHKRLS